MFIANTWRLATFHTKICDQPWRREWNNNKENVSRIKGVNKF